MGLVGAGDFVPTNYSLERSFVWLTKIHMYCLKLRKTH